MPGNTSAIRPHASHVIFIMGCGLFGQTTQTAEKRLLQCKTNANTYKTQPQARQNRSDRQTTTMQASKISKCNGKTASTRHSTVNRKLLQRFLKNLCILSGVLRGTSAGFFTQNDGALFGRQLNLLFRGIHIPIQAINQQFRGRATKQM